MKQQIRLVVAACFYYSGLVPLMRWRGRNQEQRLIILNYHRASGKGLRGQLLYLRRHYRLLHLEQALEELQTRRRSPSAPSHQPPPTDRRVPLVLTFDDGYRDNYTHLFPLARELGVPVTIFLIPSYLDSGAPFWWLEGERLVRRAQVLEVSLAGRTYHLEEEPERTALAQVIDAQLRYAPSVAAREAFLATMRSALAVPPTTSDEVERAALPLSWGQVREMAASGWVTFGAHTLHHPVLACLREPGEVAQEVGACRAVLEEQLGQPVRTFAYPIGKLRHIGDEALRTVKEAGYDWALTSIEEVATARADPYLLPRRPGVETTHWLVMASELAGLLGIWSRLRRNCSRILRRASGVPLRLVMPGSTCLAHTSPRLLHTSRASISRRERSTTVGGS